MSDVAGFVKHIMFDFDAANNSVCIFEFLLGVLTDLRRNLLFKTRIIHLQHSILFIFMTKILKYINVPSLVEEEKSM